MKNILKILLILLLLIIPISASAQQDIYANCESEIFESSKYFKLSSIAYVHKLTLQWNDTDKTAIASFNGKKIAFNTVNDIVYIDNEKYYFGDILLYNGYTYIPEDSTTLFNDGYSAYLLNNSSNIKYIEGKITRIDIDNETLKITKLMQYEINQSKYFCIDEFAELYNIVPVKTAENDYIMISSNNHEMYFYVQTDYIGYNGSYFTPGDIILKDGKFYAPESVIQYMLEVFLPDFKNIIDNTSDDSVAITDKYTSYIFDNTDKKYVSLKEVSSINGYKYQWYFVNKYAEVKIDTITYYVLVPTNVIMKDNEIFNAYDIKEENDIVYIEYDALSIFGLIENNEQNSVQEESLMPQESIEEQLNEDNGLLQQYIPIRQLAQKINGVIQWDSASYSAILTHKDLKYVFNTKQMKIYINDIEITGYDFKFEEGITLVNTSIEDLIYSSIILSEKTETYDLLLVKSPAISVKTHYLLNSPQRIVVDLLNVNKLNIDTTQGNNYSSIRILNDNEIKRLVFDLYNKCSYEIKKYDGYIELKIYNQESLTQEPVTENQNHDSVQLPQNKVKVAIFNDQIKVITDEYDGYEIKRLSDPNRLIVFIPESLCESAIINPTEGSRYIKAVKTTCDDSGTYISIELISQCRYEISERDKTEFIIDIFSQKILNMSYYNSSNRKYIQITGLALADQYGKVNSNVKITNNDLITEISFIDPTYRLTSGVLYLNDDYIEKIQIKRNDEQVVMVIYAKKLLQLYFNSARSTYTNINFLPLDDTYSGYVVIDAGHGGYDPGAVAGSIYESTINLSIAKKVKQLLADKSINVFMIRDTDEYVGLYERAHIANIIKASLFVSIHSNAFANTGYKGIMTLVYPSYEQSSSMTGRILGTRIQNNLIAETQGIDRGVIDRPNLVVLNSTKMPAALVECGFMTNPDELKDLQTEEYQNILAQGIVKGIIESLNSD
ncbi:MAG: N-acetylmuramoyl-L-alanine amidase [Clostridia bacterium]|jgi:N-acetylmuramoyl-L-alanine amidase